MKRRAVFVRWHDAADHNAGNWTPLPGVPEVVITTVAMLVDKTSTTLVLAQSFDDNDEPLFRNVFTIPRSAVIEMRDLSHKPKG